MVNGESGEMMNDNNYGTNKVMQEGTTCLYKGKQIACFVACSPKASITSKILVDMLKHIDKQDLWKRENGENPFLVLDGHGS